MSASFASIHFIGVDEINDEYVALIKPYIQRKIILDFLDLPEPEIFAVESNNILSLYSEEFGVESIDKTVCKCYKDKSMPTIVTGGILDGDVISISVI